MKKNGLLADLISSANCRSFSVKRLSERMRKASYSSNSTFSRKASSVGWVGVPAEKLCAKLTILRAFLVNYVILVD